MTTYQTPIIVGIFEDEGKAKDAVEALREAGLQQDQIGVAFQGSNNTTPNLEQDLMELGIPQDQANYYDQQYQSGNIVVSVRPDGRDHEVSDILHTNGAYDYETGTQHAADDQQEQDVE